MGATVYKLRGPANVHRGLRALERRIPDVCRIIDRIRHAEILHIAKQVPLTFEAVNAGPKVACKVLNGNPTAIRIRFNQSAPDTEWITNLDLAVIEISMYRGLSSRAH